MRSHRSQGRRGEPHVPRLAYAQHEVVEGLVVDVHQCHLHGQGKVGEVS